jgi:hypothetical protein
LVVMPPEELILDVELTHPAPLQRRAPLLNGTSRLRAPALFSVGIPTASHVLDAWVFERSPDLLDGFKMRPDCDARFDRELMLPLSEGSRRLDPMCGEKHHPLNNLGCINPRSTASSNSPSLFQLRKKVPCASGVQLRHREDWLGPKISNISLTQFCFAR